MVQRDHLGQELRDSLAPFGRHGDRVTRPLVRGCEGSERALRPPAERAPGLVACARQRVPGCQRNAEMTSRPKRLMPASSSAKAGPVGMRSRMIR